METKQNVMTAAERIEEAKHLTESQLDDKIAALNECTDTLKELGFGETVTYYAACQAIAIYMRELSHRINK